MRRLSAAGAQQADSRRAAVRRGRVEVLELNIEMRPQRVRHQTSRVNVSPGQRTDVNDQQLKRLSIGRQRVREFRLTLIFRSVKLESHAFRFVDVGGAVCAGISPTTGVSPAVATVAAAEPPVVVTVVVG